MKSILFRFISFLLLAVLLVILLLSIYYLSSKENCPQHEYYFSPNDVESFGLSQYECSAYCYCEENDEFVNRRVSRVESKGGVNFVFSAVSVLVAYSLAKDYFSEECEDVFSDEDCLVVRSEIDSCSGVHEGEEDQEKTVEDDIRNEAREPPEKYEKCVLCVGDSMTEGYSSVNPKIFHPYSTELQSLIDKDSENYDYSYKVSSFGVTGECTQKMLPRCQNVFEKVSQEKDVSHVVIFGGLIDCIMDQEEAEHAIGNLQCMYTHCLKNDGVLVFSVKFPDQEFDYFEKNKRGTLARKKEYNQRLEAVCDETERLYLVDVGDYSSMTEEEQKRYWEDDKLHYSPDGYDMIARKIYKVLREYL